jgi:subtilisin-like proprotein convertase family protein
MKSHSSNVVLAAFVLSSGALAQQKDAAHAEMSQLAARAEAAKVAGNGALAQQLMDRYQAISARLGGDVPVASSAALTPSFVGTGGPLFAVQPADCNGSPLVTYAAVAGTTGPILDVQTVTFTALVAGVANPVWDVDVLTGITHTYAADLDITVISPAGTRCEISSDNGGANDDVFSNTLWDDQSANPVTSYIFTNAVAAPDLKPENPLNSTFRGENANGTWTLEIVDDVGADVGNVNSWSLTITDGNINPPPVGGPQVVFTSSPNLPIVDFTQTIDSIAVSGVGTQLVDIDVYLEITHTWNADLVISLTSPGAVTGVLSDRHGGANDDVFNGTLFDQSSLNAIGSYLFTNGVAAPDLRPAESFDVFTGCNATDPNGTWTLTVEDFAGLDVGTLARWDLKISTAGGSCTGTSYCTSSTTSNGCNPSLSATGSASIAGGPGSFMLNCTGVEGQKSGLIFYGIAGPNNVPWATGSTSFLCVKAPTQRMQTQSSGGTGGQCNGSLTQDFFHYVVNLNPGALGNPLTAGQTYNSQAWFRDPPAPKTTNLSDGYEFNLCP